MVAGVLTERSENKARPGLVSSTGNTDPSRLDALYSSRAHPRHLIHGTCPQVGLGFLR
jgi:hypothetical protein